MAALLRRLDLIDEIEVHERRQKLQLIRRGIRDCLNPFTEMDEEQLRITYRLPPILLLELTEILKPYLTRPRRITCLSAEQKVLIAVRFYASGSYQKCVGDSVLTCVSQPSVSRAIRSVTRAINTAMLNDWVYFPTNENELQLNKQRFMETTGFPGVMGALDCTHILIISPPGEEEAVYVDRRNNHSLNVQLICNYDVLIMDVNARYPGSTHDAAIWRLCNVKRTLMRRYRNGDVHSWVLGDSGYGLEPWLLTPVLHAADGTPEARYTMSHCRARCAIERCNGLLKSRFRCLSKARQLNYAPHIAALIVNACVVLHNFCVRNKLPLYLNVGEHPVPDVEGLYPEPYEVNQDVQNDGRRARDLLIRRYFQ